MKYVYTVALFLNGCLKLAELLGLYPGVSDVTASHGPFYVISFSSK